MFPDDDSGVDLDVGSELSLRDEDATARDTDDDNSDAALRENQGNQGDIFTSCDIFTYID